ncbi:hypothetical protein AHAS_Ahas19G0101300 [Arachis hypogaea]
MIQAVCKDSLRVEKSVLQFAPPITFLRNLCFIALAALPSSIGVLRELWVVQIQPLTTEEAMYNITRSLQPILVHKILMEVNKLKIINMPKQKRYKNLLKAVAAANSSQDKSIAVTNLSRDKATSLNASQVKSVAAANSSQDTSAATNFSRDKSAAATNFSRDKSAAAANSSRDKSAAASNSSRDKSAASNSSWDKSAASNSSRSKSATVSSSSRDKSTASNSSEPSSVAPTISEHLSEPKRKRGRESKHYWTIDAIYEYEDSRSLHLLVNDVHNFSEGLRIIVNFDKQHVAIGEAAGLLAGARFCFKVSDSLAKQFLLQSLGKKWREHRIKLWNEFYDPKLSKTEIINNTPEDIAPDQWALFVEYRLKPETQSIKLIVMK